MESCQWAIRDSAVRLHKFLVARNLDELILTEQLEASVHAFVVACARPRSLEARRLVLQLLISCFVVDANQLFHQARNVPVPIALSDAALPSSHLRRQW